MGGGLGVIPEGLKCKQDPGYGVLLWCGRLILMRKHDGQNRLSIITRANVQLQSDNFIAVGCSRSRNPTDIKMDLMTTLVAFLSSRHSSQK